MQDRSCRFGQTDAARTVAIESIHPPALFGEPMSRKVLLGACLLMLALTTVLFLWVRAVFTEDTVRTALAQQLSNALGQPVTVGGISAGIYPRVTVNLKDVTIGEPIRIRVRTLHVGASLGALFSRRIEHARLDEILLARFRIARAAFGRARVDRRDRPAQRRADQRRSYGRRRHRAAARRQRRDAPESAASKRHRDDRRDRRSAISPVPSVPSR